MKNVVFIPFQEKKDLIYSLNTADVHIVTNAKGVKGVSVPSKIYGILAVNKPIWGILEEGSEAWRIIEESQCGVLVHAGDYAAMESSLAEIIQQNLSEHPFISRKHVDGYSICIQSIFFFVCDNLQCPVGMCLGELDQRGDFSGVCLGVFYAVTHLNGYT